MVMLMVMMLAALCCWWRWWWKWWGNGHNNYETLENPLFEQVTWSNVFVPKKGYLRSLVKMVVFQYHGDDWWWHHLPSPWLGEVVNLEAFGKPRKWLGHYDPFHSTLYCAKLVAICSKKVRSQLLSGIIQQLADLLVQPGLNINWNIQQ